RGGGHAGERLGDGHGRTRIAFLRLVKAHRVDPRDHVVAQVRGLEAAGLQGGDDALHLRVDLDEARGKIAAGVEAGTQGPVAEAVNFFQKAAVGAAGEARRLLVNDAEREQLRRLEFARELELAFAPAG